MVRVAVLRAQHPQLHLEYITHEAASERTIARVYDTGMVHNSLTETLGINTSQTGCGLTLSGIAPSRSHGPGLPAVTLGVS